MVLGPEFMGDELLKLVQEKKIILDDIITHVLLLDQGPYAYEIFCNKKITV